MAEENGQSAAPKKSNFISQVPPAVRAELAEDLKPYEGKDITEFVQEHVKLARTVRDRGIIVPNAESSPEEKKAFHERMGLPEKAEEYQFKFDEAVLPKEAVEAARAFVHANGYTQKQAQAYVSSLESIAKSARDATSRRKSEGDANKMPALVREFGGDTKAAEAAYTLGRKFISSHHSPPVRTNAIATGLACQRTHMK